MATEDEMDVEAQHFTMEVDRPVNTLNPITPPSTPTDPASDIPTNIITQPLDNPIQSSSSSSSKDPHIPPTLSTTSATQPQTPPPPPPHSHPNPFLQHPHSQLLSSARRAVADVLAKCSADLLLPDCSHVVLIDGDVKLRQGLLALLENGTSSTLFHSLLFISIHLHFILLLTHHSSILTFLYRCKRSCRHQYSYTRPTR